MCGSGVAQLSVVYRVLLAYLLTDYFAIYFALRSVLLPLVSFSLTAFWLDNRPGGCPAGTAPLTCGLFQDLRYSVHDPVAARRCNSAHKTAVELPGLIGNLAGPEQTPQVSVPVSPARPTPGITPARGCGHHEQKRGNCGARVALERAAERSGHGHAAGEAPGAGPGRVATRLGSFVVLRRLRPLTVAVPTASLLQGSSTARPSTPTTTESPLDWLRATAGQWLGFARGLTLAGLTTASSAVAGAGLALLLFLLVTAGLAPPRDTFARPLTLDFSQADLVGEAVFLPGALPVDGLLPSDAQSGARCGCGSWVLVYRSAGSRLC